MGDYVSCYFEAEISRDRYCERGSILAIVRTYR